MAKIITSTGNSFKLELSFVEMHVLMQAMADYANAGYNRRGTNPETFNESHAAKTEQLHEQMLECYTAMTSIDEEWLDWLKKTKRKRI